MAKENYIIEFNELSLKDIAEAGSKGAALGEMYRHLSQEGVRIPNGFVITATAYRTLLSHNQLDARLDAEMAMLDPHDLDKLRLAGKRLRAWLMSAAFPTAMISAITAAYGRLAEPGESAPSVAVRSSVIAEDLPEAAFAGQQDSYLNITGEDALLTYCKLVFASLYTDRAIAYRAERGYGQIPVALAIVVQRMVRADLAASGVMFTLDTESGFRDVVLISGAYGLGENVVQNAVIPDEFLVFKPTLRQGFSPIIKRKLGSKAIQCVYTADGQATQNLPTPELNRRQYCLTDPEVLRLARLACAIERHYSNQLGHPQPVGVEWAKDGRDGQLYIVQARPEPVHARSSTEMAQVRPPLELASYAAPPLLPTARPRTQIMLNIGNPDQAFKLASLPVDGVGLARLEFIVSHALRVHPRAILNYDLLPAETQRQIETLAQGYPSPGEFYVQRLAEGISQIAAAFYPKPVMIRLSDFKSNEYGQLLGGRQYEPVEENPMVGLRGAARYYAPGFDGAFALECQALKRVREEFGLLNVAVMIPFVRTVNDLKAVLAGMAQEGLVRGTHNLKVYVMCEIPANALLAEDFLAHCDGFSIGSNDLTQLTLGIDRDSGLLRGYDERNPAVLSLMALAIAACRRAGKYVGICGQAPSDFPEITRWLVEREIQSISLNPDSVMAMLPVILAAE